jgi:hypothetical protein
MGWQRPNMLAEMRAMKAEGGWGVVNYACYQIPT